jgi:hypothetical protein
MADECPARPDYDPPAAEKASAWRRFTTNLTNLTNEGRLLAVTGSGARFAPSARFQMIDRLSIDFEIGPQNAKTSRAQSIGS